MIFSVRRDSRVRLHEPGIHARNAIWRLLLRCSCFCICAKRENGLFAFRVLTSRRYNLFGVPLGTFLADTFCSIPIIVKAGDWVVSLFVGTSGERDVLRYIAVHEMRMDAWGERC